MKSMIDKMMEVPTRNFLDPVICRYPHPASHWQNEDGHKEILSHARILIPEKNPIEKHYHKML